MADLRVVAGCLLGRIDHRVSENNEAFDTTEEEPKFWTTTTVRSLEAKEAEDDDTGRILLRDPITTFDDCSGVLSRYCSRTFVPL